MFDSPADAIWIATSFQRDPAAIPVLTAVWICFANLFTFLYRYRLIGICSALYFTLAAIFFALIGVVICVTFFDRSYRTPPYPCWLPRGAMDLNCIGCGDKRGQCVLAPSWSHGSKYIHVQSR